MTRKIDDLIPPEFSPLSIARMVWKRKGLIVLLWALITTAVYFGVQRLPTTYSAEAVVMIDSPKVSEKYVSPATGGDVQDRITALSQQVLSTTQLSRLIEVFGLYGWTKGAPVSQSAIDALRAEIKIRSDRRESGRTGAFRISYSGADPVLVAEIANRVANLFIEQNLKTREGQVEGTSEFIDTQLQESKSKLEGLEDALSRYKLTHNGELPQQLVSLMGTLDRSQSSLAANREAIARTQQQLAVLESNLANAEALQPVQMRSLESARAAAAAAAAVPSTAGERVPVPAPAVLKRNSEALQAQLSQLQYRYGDEHPDVRRLKVEINRLLQLEAQQQQQKLEAAAPSQSPVSTASTAPATAVPDLSRDLSEVQRTAERISSLKAQIAETQRELANRKSQEQAISQEMAVNQGRVDRIPLREQEMARVTRDYDISIKNYQSLLDKKLGAQMATELEKRQKSERFTLIEPARVPEKSVSTNGLILKGIGCLAGLAIGLVLALALELHKGSFLGEWELPAGVPVLGRLPVIRMENKVQRSFLWRRLLTASSVLIGALVLYGFSK